MIRPVLGQVMEPRYGGGERIIGASANYRVRKVSTGHGAWRTRC